MGASGKPQTSRRSSSAWPPSSSDSASHVPASSSSGGKGPGGFSAPCNTSSVQCRGLEDLQLFGAESVTCSGPTAGTPGTLSQPGRHIVGHPNVARRPWCRVSRQVHQCGSCRDCHLRCDRASPTGGPRWPGRRWRHPAVGPRGDRWKQGPILPACPLPKKPLRIAPGSKAALWGPCRRSLTHLPLFQGGQFFLWQHHAASRSHEAEATEYLLQPSGKTFSPQPQPTAVRCRMLIPCRMLQMPVYTRRGTR